jgi:hypothetical protein
MEPKQNSQGSQSSLVPKGINLPAERMQTTKGLGKLDAEDILLPRLKIAQPTSPEVADGLVKPGQLFNSVSKESFGTSLSLIPILWFKSRIYWKPRDEGGILCQAQDGVTGSVYGACADCKFSKWHDKDAPECTAIINILALADRTPLAISFMKTSYKTGKQLINLFNYKKVDIFNFEYELLTEQIKNDKGIFYVVRHKDQNKAVSDEMYKFCSGAYEELKSMKVKIHDLEEAETTEEAPF